MTAYNSKELFTVLGQVRLVDGKKRFVPSSTDHLASLMARLPIGKLISCTFFDKVPTRSAGQLAYHWVLVTYIADYTGDCPEEMHDAIMREKFGTKKIKLKDKVHEVRRSISNRQDFLKQTWLSL